MTSNPSSPGRRSNGEPVRRAALARVPALAFLCAAALVGGSAAAQTVFAPPAAPTLPTPNAEFLVLDTVQGSNVDIVFWSIDGMVFNTDQSKFFATSPYGGRVLQFDADGGPPERVIQVPWGVTSLAYWVSDVDEHEELLALSRGNYGLSRINPETGAIFDFIQLPTEPADILIEPVTNHVFVSCSGDDVVVELDLENGVTHDVFDITGSRNIAFLSTDGSGTVYAAPMTSGNNSLALRSGTLGHDQVQGTFVQTGPNDGFYDSFPIVDMSDTNNSTTGLPDEDLYALNPSSSPNSGTVTVEATGLGTTLCGHGFHPTLETNNFWILTTEANNKDPNLQSEALVKGNIFTNRLTMTTLGATPGEGDHVQVSLDDMVIPPATSGSGQAVGQGFDMHFASDGTVYVIGLLTDNVVQVDSAGAVLKVWDLDDGSIPRDIIVNETTERAYVYCWGTNEVVVIDLATDTILTPHFDLGYDPTSDLRKAGRAIFYDGHNSEHGNVSCESCHTEGMTDFLPWDLSDKVKDNKGPMITQMLRGINDLNPYHWRGERAGLIDFNGAFEGLLGGTSLSEEPGGAFDQFQAFVFGMEEVANPRTHPYRVLVNDDPEVKKNFNLKGDTELSTLSAIVGQDLYMTEQTVGVNTCFECHTLPTGTANDFFHDGLFDQDHRSSLDVPAYNGLWRKEQKERHYDIDVLGNLEDRPPLGSGTTHAGLRTGLYEFVTEVFLTPLSLAEAQDIALFMHQIDSGMAPAVHKAVLLDQAHLTGATAYAEFMRNRALAGDCDLVLFGTVTTTSGVKRLRWFYDTNLAIPTWVCEDTTQPNRRIQYFITQATNGTGSNMIVGLPPGMGRRWGVDYDDDRMFNGLEDRVGSDPFDPDTDDDGFWDGLEVQYSSDPLDDQDTPSETDAPSVDVELVYVSASVAKLNIRTSEPTTISVAYFNNGTPAANSPATSDELGSVHTVILTGLQPSYATESFVNTVTGTVTATDQSTNPTAVALTSFTTENFIIAIEQAQDPIIEETIIQELDFVSQTPQTGGGTRLVYEGQLLHQMRTVDPELVDHAFVGKIFTKSTSETEFTLEKNFTIENFPGGSIAGPLLFGDALGGVGPPSGAVYPGVGPFLISPATPADDPGTTGVNEADGRFQLDFILPAAVDGDEVIVVVETVSKVDPNTWPGNPPILDGAFHFPASPPEARCTDPLTIVIPAP